MKPTARWAIISGGPSVGKTTVILRLRHKGFPIIEEVGTRVIKGGVFHPARDRHAFQAEVLRRQLEEESTFQTDVLTWGDRGLLDGAAYYLNDGLAVPEQFLLLDVSHYLVVFLLEPLTEFERDGIRPAFEDLEFTHRITPLLEQVYRERGVLVVRVQAMSIEQRIAFIESKVDELIGEA
jgi:predicted ATPase